MLRKGPLCWSRCEVLLGALPGQNASGRTPAAGFLGVDRGLSELAIVEIRLSFRQMGCPPIGMSPRKGRLINTTDCRRSSLIGSIDGRAFVSCKPDDPQD